MKKNLSKYLAIALFVAIIVVGILGYFTYKLSNENELKDKVILQNEKAYNDSLRILNDEWTTKYAFVEDLNKDKDSLLVARDETILTKNKVILQLTELKSEGAGEVKKDSLNPEVNYYEFSNSNVFSSYKLTVWTNPPYHKLRQKFNSFPITVYLTENKEGLFSGYGEIPKELKEYISIKDIDIRVDKYEYEKLVEERTRIDVGLGGNILIAPEVYLGAGADLLIDLKHKVGYTYYLGVGHHEVDYRWFFNVKR